MNQNRLYLRIYAKKKKEYRQLTQERNDKKHGYMGIRTKLIHN